MQSYRHMCFARVRGEGMRLIERDTELSLTVPIVNSLAFLFTVLGEWWADGKVIGRDTWVGMAFVLGGITLCVHSKHG